MSTTAAVAPDADAKTIADEYAASFFDLALTVTEDEKTVDRAWNRFNKSLNAAPHVNALLVPLVFALRSMNIRNAERQKRIEQLETRLAALEAAPRGLEDAGAHETGRAYRKGVGVSAAGSYWVSVRDTKGHERPGDGSGAFRLIAKKGRDGRDGKDLR